MDGTKPRLRTDDLFDQQCLSLDLSGEVPRFAEIIRAIRWALTHDPLAYPEIDEHGTRIILTEPFPGAPELRAFYTIDEDGVPRLRFIELQVPPSEAEDYSG